MNRATEYETPNIIKINELFPTPYIVEFSANLIKKRLYYSTFINKNTEIAYCIFAKTTPVFLSHIKHQTYHQTFPVPPSARHPPS